ncbi:MULTISPECIES: 3-hydroxyacyl-CoA dehydrogenase NAD-binding domain-containing protein [Acinetobacter]|jgi:3-hydroxyacyl-CoA dehydrogenase/enoyl-CoA hydratase/3-hydroxybutyryl-CoA epimerase|uniref:enoyl-CoA hydratase n=3 Tax=Gammaproteobacteria TaxID=1236 RepID=A0AAW6RR22_ACIJO|nr:MULTISPECIES: 3-hydroxyacyl-CoA dehydrogenase NAD-binding domain-containing protein [Acinetobacter]ALV72005.1 3-hydroxyacyl-CoA dehydrogenase [Acinetobacter johnsonii XBB1]MCV2451490.1 3-hydroxyacyl-CoA dehydrogenase NAD-binding domain-containing protein [Acinetobacter johnsonii]MDG9785438.1 3-hydroxyacyl-CoA dehydrogenase NAD-binding domain-containing protein [Acinetobacter johnsonii]MDG9798591.1 3-hydroxyacyl-CoA dehydrogenase NAD-binding domain-containing protein [Acinetobacter johnsonii]
MSAIQYLKNDDGIIILTLDSPNQSVNTMNGDFRVALENIVSKLKSETSITGIIFRSAKKTFFAGGDLDELIQARLEDATPFFEMIQKMKAEFRYIETLGVPVVAALNGTALGGGWEIALGCHARIALNDPKTKFGLPEVTLGLLPGGGGIVRMVRLLGLQNAFPFLMEGKQFGIDKAKSLGLIQDTAETSEELMDKAIAWVKEHPKSQQPFDVKGYKIPGGDPKTPVVAQMLAIAPAMLRDKTKGCYPAPEAIMAAAVEGTQVDVDTALTIESRYFTYLATGQVSKNMIGTFWHGMNAIKAGASRPKDVAKWQASKVGVLGAGMMGAGIAYSTAIKGVPVVLKDVSVENAEKGKAYSQKLLDKKVSQGRMTAEKRDQVLSLITATASVEDLKGCDLIIEAVFENQELKAKVTQEAEAFLAEGGVMASNTSTLPITGLANASKDQANFIGLHFFSPVDKMQLVEIIKGKNTSAETLAKAYDYVQQIGKIPIVVNDSRGFFTSRVFGTFVQEGLRLLHEGVHPARIEMAALKAGMPVGPLAIQDEVALTLSEHVANETRKALQAEGKDLPRSGADDVIQTMIHTFDRKGKAAGAGFYDYPEGGKKHLWEGLKHWKQDVDISEQEMIDRFLFVQSLDTLRCYEENVLESVIDANIGSIFGIGFAPWTGGAIQFLNQYGLDQAVQRASELEAKYGERFKAPQRLVESVPSGQIR